MSGRSDDKTQILPGTNMVDNDRTIIPNQQQGPGGNAPLRGTVIGGLQPPRQPAGSPAPNVPGGRPPAQGETIFVVPQGNAAPGAAPFDPVIGWMVVTKGPGRGHFKPVYYGSNSIGRGSDQRIIIDFGDQRISRETHAYIVYDDVQRQYYVRDNGRSNLVRHNGNLVMAPTEIKDRDLITIGETVLMFIALCNADFDWLANTDEPSKA